MTLSGSICNNKYERCLKNRQSSFANNQNIVTFLLMMGSCLIFMNVLIKLIIKTFARTIKFILQDDTFA